MNTGIYIAGYTSAKRKNPIFSFKVGCTIELRNDPIDQNQPRKQPINRTVMTANRGLIFSKSSGDRAVVAIERTIAICPPNITPNRRRKICQCLARRKRAAIRFMFPPDSRSAKSSWTLISCITNSFCARASSTPDKSPYRNVAFCLGGAAVIENRIHQVRSASGLANSIRIS